MSTTVRLVLGEIDLGPVGWQKLHELARLRGRRPHAQARQLLLYALDRALAGQDTELSPNRLNALFAQPLEPVA
jgi:hypothetical protein